jgi:hypothetical protein
MRSFSGFGRGVDWWIIFDISGQSIDPVFKGQEILEFLTLEDG